MGEAKRKADYVSKAAALLDRHEREAESDKVPVQCIRCGERAVAVIATGCRCGGTFLQAPNGSSPPAAVDPLAISTECYLLDALLMHAQTVAQQLAFRGNVQRAQQLIQLCQPISAFRQQVDADTRSGIVLAGPGSLPKVS